MTFKAGFEKRIDITTGDDSLVIERWSAEQVEAARVYYGHEPSAHELREYNSPEVTNH